MDLPIFETERLILKGLSIEDAPYYQKHFAGYEMIQHLSNRVPQRFSEDGALKFIKDFVLPNQGNGRWA